MFIILFSRGAGVRDEKSQAQSCQVSNQADHSSIDGGLLVSFPLHDAVAFCKPDVVKLLLAHGANPNSLDHDGNNALHVAVKTKNIEIIKFILNSDVDINHNNFKHMTPLFHAIDDQELKIVKLICQTGKVNLNILFGPEQYSYLSFLICECPDSKEILKVLLSHGANPNLLHDENVTPLYLAAQENRKELVDLLLDFGAKPNLATVDNITPLMIASKHPNSSELIHSLLSHKADVDTKRLSNSSTPLMLAVQNDAAKVADTLLKAKANVNESSLSQVTPLSLAISKENTRILEILVKHGANLNQIIHDGLTPLMYAVELGCPEVIRKLLEYEMVEVNAISNGCTALILACEEGHIELVQLLLEKGGDSNIVKGEHSPLYIAVLLQNLPMAQMLLSYGAQANPKCEPYPLVKAMSNKQDAMVELLLKNGAAADVSLTGPNSIWISAIQSGHPPNLRQLRDKLGGSFGEIVLDDKTHLSVAIDFRAKAVIEWLLRQPGVTPSSTELALIRILTHLIAIDRVIEDAYILRRQFSVPSENNLKKREGLSNVLEDLKKVQYQFSQLSLVSGLTYVDNLVQQLRSLIDEIQSIYDRHYKYDGRLSPN